MESTNSLELIRKSIDTNNDSALEELSIKCYNIMKSDPQYKQDDYDRCIKEVCRFYLSEKKNITSAQERWQAWSYWFCKYHPETISEADVQNEIKLGKAFIHKCDKEGRTCIIIKQSLHDPSKSDFEELIRLGFYLMERAVKQSEKTPKKEICVIFDRINFGWSNVDKRLTGKRGMLGLIQDYYNEKVHKMYIYPVNWLFKTLQKLVRPFLSKQTQEKLVLCNYEEELFAFFDKDKLISEIGGTSNFQYQYPNNIEYI